MDDKQIETTIETDKLKNFYTNNKMLIKKTVVCMMMIYITYVAYVTGINNGGYQICVNKMEMKFINDKNTGMDCITEQELYNRNSFMNQQQTRLQSGFNPENVQTTLGE